MSLAVLPGLQAMTDSTTDHRWAALIVLCAGMLMIVLDATIVNVALPSIQTDLHFSPSGLAWVLNAYLLTFGGLLMLAGRIGDLTSRRGVFTAGLGVFTIASVLCGMAPSQGWLVAARFVQGTGGAMTSAVILGVIVTMFPERREQAKALGIYGFVASAGGSIGLLAGGVLTSALNWHWIFFVNVPIGVATIIAARRLIPADRDTGPHASARGADAAGAMLITGGVTTLVYAIVGPAARNGWGATTTIVWFAVAIVLLVAFVAREATCDTALIPLRIFRVRPVVGANLIQVCSFAGMYGISFLLVLYLQRIQGDTPLQTGLAFLPITVVMGTLSVRYAERLAARFAPHTILLPGLTFVAAGMLLFTRIPVHAHYLVDVLPPLVLIGAGFGISMPTLMTLAMSGATPRDAGVASGLVNTTAQVGGALGLAVLATLSSGRTGHLLAGGASRASALVGGYHVAFVVSSGLCLTAVGVVAVLLTPRRGRAPVTAQSNA
jgi:EmrB/QacA subfamily drug resistance transporter